MNDRSVRVLHLLDQHPAFGAMVDDPTVRELVSSVLGERYQLSSLSANISLPGSESMGMHNDLMAVLPEPWLAPYGTNLFICLDDMDEENGATRYLPGSHRFTTNDMASHDDLARTVAIPATAGSVVAMDGRLWHTSGANRSADRPRRILIAFYVASFIRTQYNWAALLSEPAQQRAHPEPAPGARSRRGQHGRATRATPPSAAPGRASTPTPTDRVDPPHRDPRPRHGSLPRLLA